MNSSVTTVLPRNGVVSLLTRGVLLVAVTMGLFVVVSPRPAGALENHCGRISQALVVSAGFMNAATPVVTKYNYTTPSKNTKNAFGTTYDFGSTGPVISCLAPADLKSLAKTNKTSTSVSAFVSWLRRQPGLNLRPTAIASIADQFTTGTGAQHGLGSLAKAASVRLDVFTVQNQYVVLLRTTPGLMAVYGSLQNLGMAIAGTL